MLAAPTRPVTHLRHLLSLGLHRCRSRLPNPAYYSIHDSCHPLVRTSQWRMAVRRGTGSKPEHRAAALASPTNADVQAVSSDLLRAKGAGSAGMPHHSDSMRRSNPDIGSGHRPTPMAMTPTGPSVLYAGRLQGILCWHTPCRLVSL